MSYESRKVAAQKSALAALATVARTFGHLPAAEFHVSRVYPDRLSIRLYSNLTEFEVWREALGIPVDAVEYRTQPGDSVLTAITPWGGAIVELVGYGPLPKDADGGEES